MAGNNTFEALLQSMLSSDNQARSAAEAQFLEAKKSPDALVGNLVQVLRSSGSLENRSLSAVMLRRVLTKDEPSVWGRLSPQVQEFTKQNLLTSIKEEKDRSINKKVCDTTAELAAGMVDSSGWQELLPFVFQLVQSPDPGSTESALLIFSQLAHYVMPVLTQYMGTLNGILQQTLQSQHPAVGLAAMKAATAFIQELEEPSDRDKFQPLVPSMLGTIAMVLNANDEVSAQEALELFIEVAEAHPRFLRKQLGEVLTAMLQIAEADSLESSTRQLAAEFLVTLCEAREKAPGMMRKLPQIIGRLFQCLMSFLLDIEDDSDWHRADTDTHENDGEGELYDFGQECLDRLALSMGGNSITPLAAQVLPQWIQSSDWKQRHAGLISLAQIAEGCAKVMAKNMSGLVDICLKGLQDEHPKVRWAGCQALGQMCTDLEPELQEVEHGRIIPALLTLTDNFSHPRVQAHAAAAIVNFTEGADEEILPPYLEALTTKLLALLRNGQKTVQEGALTALASVADCSKSHFLSYYGQEAVRDDEHISELYEEIDNASVCQKFYQRREQVMPMLREVLTHCNDKSLHMMRAKALECISLVGMSIGKDRFREDAHQVLQYMQSLQSQGMDPDDPTVSYMLQAGARLCKCLGEEFIPYLGIVMPPLMNSAQLKPDVNISISDSDEEEQSDDEENETIYMGDKKVSIKTTVLEEKATACSMICCYADELKEGFYPYVAEVATIMVPLIKFFFHEEVRRSAVQSLPEMLESAKVAADKNVHGATKQNVKQLLDFFWPALMEGLSKEPDLDILGEMLEAVQMMIDLVAPELLGQDQLVTLFECLQKILDQSAVRRGERMQRVQAEDFDEEEAEALEDENEEEEDLLDKAGGVLTSVLKEYKDQAMPLIDKLMPQIGQMLDQSRSAGERRVAICILDDLLEHSSAGAQKYMGQILPVLLEASKSQDPNLRQCSVFGLGVLAEHRSEGFQQIAASAIQTLLAIINAPDSRDEENANATENAIASLGKVVEFQSSVVDASQSQVLANVWLNALPLTEDEVEAQNVHRQLIRFIEKQDSRILGENNKNLPKIVEILTVVLSREDLMEAKFQPRALELLKQLQTNVPSQIFQEVASKLKPKEAEHLKKLMAA